MKKIKLSRFFALYVFVFISFLVILSRLVFLHTKNSESANKTLAQLLSLSEAAPAPRGKIYDRNGTLLAGNRDGFIILIKKSDTASLDLTLKNLASLQNISYDELTRVVNASGFSYSDPYVFLEDAPKETVIKIRESPEKYPSLYIKSVPIREYFYPETLVHLLGRCGIISKEEYEKNPTYARDDYIGKQGAERAFEEILRGEKGSYAKEKRTKNEIKKFTEDILPKAGNDIVLTVDINLQSALENSLDYAISKNSSAVGGAGVIIDVNSGEILALASNPDYNINNFGRDYTKLSHDKNKPFFNRCLSGLYEPGSTFKPITAIAALENGAVSPDEKIKTLGKYEYFDRVFRCNIYRERGTTHGTINIKKALGVSCNYFFYEIGKRVGIEKIAEYAEKFGLGSPTGIELTAEEATGTVASPDKKRASGTPWYAGDTLQAAIGQSGNRFTPIAMCNYISAVANGGTLYSAHVLKEIRGEEQTKISPKILNTIDISSKTLQTINEGLLYVTENGTAKEAFASLPVLVAGKTGTAQNASRTNGLFVGYAPKDAPEIAFCVVIEGGKSGTLAASVCKDFLAQYFKDEEGN